MFTNQNGCTVWEKTVQNRAPAYVRHEEGPLYWQAGDAQESGADRAPKNSVLVIIPADSAAYLPKKDDRIVSGICEDSVPPASALTVIKVRDYRYSSPKTAHIEVDAE